MTLTVAENAPLADHTTLGVGGPVRAIAGATDPSDVRQALELAHRWHCPGVVLGGGSNVLVADRGFDGLVLQYHDRSWHETVGSESVRIRIGAGYSWDEVVSRCVERDWAGIECLSGIPGWTGAAPIQNIGAYGQEVASVVRAVHGIDLHSGEEQSLSASECEFSYRSSLFKTRLRGRWLVTAVELELKPHGASTVAYAELDRALGNGPRDLATVRQAVLAIRRTKSMVIDSGDPNTASAGSFFTNPIVTPAQAEAVARHVADPQTMPSFAQADGRLKLSAAWLIARTGFARGYRHGGARLSTNHVLALTNYQSASARDLLHLAIEIRECVFGKFGVRLTPEPMLLGFTADETFRLSI